MQTNNIRLPADWRRFDNVGLWGLLLFPILLGSLWAFGLGPMAYTNCVAKPPSVQLSSEAGKITLSGRVSSAAERQRIVEAAIAAYGKASVTDNLLLDGNVTSLSWAGGLNGFMKSLKETPSAVTFKLDNGRASVSGELDSPQALDLARRDVATLLGAKFPLKDELKVRAQPAKAAEPAPLPPIAAGVLGRHRLPDGDEIDIIGGGLEGKLLAFLDDKSRAVDPTLWFDFDRLHFTTGSSDLTPESLAQIKTAVAIMKAYPAAAIKIGGYTDNVGDPDANLKLSAARAERVVAELTSSGVAADRMEFAGYGEQHPIADNTTPEGRALNRRTALSVRRK